MSNTIERVGRNNLLIIGTLPEISGIGGVTIHVKRLINTIKEDKISGIELCDYKSEALITQINKIRKSKAVHIHVSNPFLKLFYVLISKTFNTKTIITLHGRYGIYNRVKNTINKLALQLCDVPILINKESYDAVKPINSRAILSPAFIHPSKDEEILPNDVMVSIQRIKNSGRILFITNASSRAFSGDGKEIYGIDFLISFFGKHKEYTLLILDPSNQYASLYSDQLTENVNILTESISFCGLIRMCDVVIRNTSTDGDSFSVKEALYFHCPVLASDVVSRPYGVFLFHYNDEKSFSNAIKSCLTSKYKDTPKEPEAIECYMDLYHELGLIACKEELSDYQH